MKITAIGGGTGLSATVSALAAIPYAEISTIVATTDTGGSTGAIRRWSGCIAWGDLRHVTNALSESATPSLQAMLFDYRFGDDEGALSGHNLGNIILHSLENLAPRPQAALDLVTHWLGINARIIPMSEEATELSAETGPQRVEGEVHIDKMENAPEKLKLAPEVSATPEAIQAIEEASLIILGPGSVMTSVVPSLLVPGIADALSRTSARKVWIQNVGQESGPMGKLDAVQTHEWLERILGFQYCDAILADQSLNLEACKIPVKAINLEDPKKPGRHSVGMLAMGFQEFLEGLEEPEE